VFDEKDVLHPATPRWRPGNVSSSAVAAAEAARPGFPPGARVELPGRGTTFVRDLPGPPGAPTVVLLHGFLATADLNWSGCYATLGERFRVLALDQRGHGRGIRSHARFRLADCADDVVALADVLGVSTFVAVGYSMGGPIAQLLWHRHPDRVDGLVLCATSRNFSNHPRQRLAFDALGVAGVAVRLTPPPVWRWLGEHVVERRLGGSAQSDWRWAEFRRNDPVKMIEAAGALGHFTSRDWIGQVDVPTAVVMTRHDRLVRPERQRKLAAAVPGATVHEIDGDHAVGVREPERFAPVLLAACLDVAGRRRALV
jgi:3-oxoadipate enol-lactonase